jgi:hypothetical protein
VHLTAPQIIDHHNRTWAGLIAKQPVHVAPTEELLRGGFVDAGPSDGRG